VPSSKNEWSYTPLPQYAFMAWCSVKKKHRDNCTFILTYVTLRYVTLPYLTQNWERGEEGKERKEDRKEN